jgi:hypothetical protein
LKERGIESGKRNRSTNQRNEIVMSGQNLENLQGREGEV